MTTPPAVVVGIDNSASSYDALDWATAEAVRRGRPLRLVHVVDWRPYGAVPLQAAPKTTDEVTDAALARVRAALTRVHPSAAAITVSARSIEGDPAGVLIAESASADLVVVGSRGLGGFRGLLAGSVGVKMAAHARCPVVVVRPCTGRPEDPDAPRHGVGRIVVGVDGSQRADRATAFAIAEADLRGVDLTVVHASRAPRAAGTGAVLERNDPADTENDPIGKSLAAHRDRHPRVRVHQVLADGNPAAVLTHESVGADLLVVGSRGRGGFIGLLLGSVSDAVIRHAGCPVAVVR